MNKKNVEIAMETYSHRIWDDCVFHFNIMQFFAVPFVLFLLYYSCFCFLFLLLLLFFVGFVDFFFYDSPYTMHSRWYIVLIPIFFCLLTHIGIHIFFFKFNENFSTQWVTLSVFCDSMKSTKQRIRKKWNEVVIRLMIVNKMYKFCLKILLR